MLDFPKGLFATYKGIKRETKAGLIQNSNRPINPAGLRYAPLPATDLTFSTTKKNTFIFLPHL